MPVAKVDWASTSLSYDEAPGAYADTNDAGLPYPRLTRVVNAASAAIDPKYLAPPWGYGATLFRLGENEDLLSRLIDNPDGFTTAVSVAIDNELFKGRVTRGARFQIGIEYKDNVPLTKAHEVPTVLLAVWAHDALAAASIKEATHPDGSSLETLGELANCEEMRIASLAGTRLRTQLAKSVLTALAFVTPKEIQPRDETTVAYHLDVPTFTMVHQPSIGTTRGSQVTSYLDMSELHAGSHGACVYYSARAGSCFYPSPIASGQPYTVPGRGTAPTAVAVPGSTGFSNHSPPVPNLVPVPVVASSHDGLKRHYVSLDADESTRPPSCGDNGALLATSGEKARLRPIATALASPMSSENGKLYGNVGLDSIEDVLRHTDKRVHTVSFPNDAKWTSLLTNVAPGGRVWDILNQETAIENESGQVTHYEIPRSKLSI